MSLEKIKMLEERVSEVLGYIKILQKEKMDLAEVKLALFSYGTHLEIYRKENAEFGLYEEKVSGLLNTLKELNQVPEEQIREYITKELFIV